MSWSDPCSNCGEHRADCNCGDWNGYKAKEAALIKSLEDWPKNPKGDYICSKEKPMPLEAHKKGRWEHDQVHETDYDNEYYIEYKCDSCGHVWKSEMPD